MAVSLRNCVAMTTVAPSAFDIGGDNARVSFRMFSLKPRKQCWTKVEADKSVVVDYFLDTILVGYVNALLGW